jgi:ATP-dependent Clp protease ATP-binding subunit ClpA
MTSNVGARDIGAPDRLRGRRERGQKDVERLFSPEFRNRLDEVVKFKQLTPEVMLRVVDKFVVEVE